MFPLWYHQLNSANDNKNALIHKEYSWGDMAMTNMIRPCSLFHVSVSFCLCVCGFSQQLLLIRVGPVLESHSPCVGLQLSKSWTRLIRPGFVCLQVLMAQHSSSTSALVLVHIGKCTSCCMHQSIQDSRVYSAFRSLLEAILRP